MGFLSGIGDLRKQYSANSATPSTTPVVEQHNSPFDRVSAIYAEHPVLIKSLGAAALTIAMKKIADQHAAATLSI
jgi:hypothetical protein